MSKRSIYRCASSMETGEIDPGPIPFLRLSCALTQRSIAVELSAAILSIAVALTLGAMSPGPSFLMVARTALAVSRKDALAAAVGRGLAVSSFPSLRFLACLPFSLRFRCYISY